MVVGEQISTDEHQIAKILISIICFYGNGGVLLNNIEREFLNYCGYPIPWQRFGSQDLKSWLITLPYIYVVKNNLEQDVVIEQSPKSVHMRDFAVKQKNSRYRFNQPIGMKRKANEDYNQLYKMKKRLEYENLPEGSLIHTSIHNISQTDPNNRYEKFEELESMLPLFYKHQALGDDFFVDIADTKLGYYVPDKGPKQTGLCAVGLTISKLTEKVRKAVNLAPRVVVMIGFQDLLNGQSISTMITDLRQLIVELKRKNIRITLVTLIPSPKLPSLQRYETRMDIFNRAILDYASDHLLSCNVIDMSTIFLKETEKFKRDFDRFKKVGKNDPYKVFSDYGRKIFLNALKSCLKEQIEYGL